MSEMKVSTEGKKLQSLLKKPYESNRTISYTQSFLDSYRPNVTFYLDEGMRRHLRQKGFIRQQLCEYTKKFILDLSYNSSRLEGGTLTLLETKQLINQVQATYTGSDTQERMVINHRNAINFVLDISKTLELSNSVIYNIHYMLSDGLLGNPRACGQLRQIPVEIGGSIYKPPTFTWTIKENFEKIISKGNAISDPFEQSFFLMVHLPYLQPFEDVNKRTSRLTANIPLIKNDLCPFSFVDVDKEDYTLGFLAVYEQNRIALLRDVFIWGYERSCALYDKTLQSLTSF